MKTKIFQSGNSEAVRIRKEFSFDSSVVEMFKRDDGVIIKSPPKNLGKAFELFTEMPSDLMIMEEVLTALKAAIVFKLGGKLGSTAGSIHLIKWNHDQRMLFFISDRAQDREKLNTHRIDSPSPITTIKIIDYTAAIQYLSLKTS